MKKPSLEIIHEGKYAAEIPIELIENETAWAPCVAMDDALKIEACPGMQALDDRGFGHGMAGQAQFLAWRKRLDIAGNQVIGSLDCYAMAGEKQQRRVARFNPGLERVKAFPEIALGDAAGQRRDLKPQPAQGLANGTRIGDGALQLHYVKISGGIQSVTLRFGEDPPQAMPS